MCDAIMKIIQLSDYRKPAPPGPSWFLLDVMRRNERGREWIALIHLVDVTCNAWVSIPGKHRNRDAAWDALDRMMAARH